MFQWTTNYQFSAPAAAAGVLITPSGSVYAYSGWVELISAVDADSVLTAIILSDPGTTPNFEVEVGTGTAGSETRIATLKGKITGLADRGHGVMRLPIPVDNIANGARVAIRMRKDGTNTTQWRWAIQYLKKPIVGNLQTSAKPTLTAPSGSNLIALNTNTTSWANGNWTQIIAATSADIVIVGLIIDAPNVVTPFEIDIGKGAAASEVVLSTPFKGYADAQVSHTSYFTLDNPLDGILSGERVVMRWRKNGTSSQQISVGLVYMEKPL